MPKKPTRASANNLRAWREYRGLSQEKLAELVGTAGNVISLLESGERDLSNKWLTRLAPHLGTTPGFLLDHDPNDIENAVRDADEAREAAEAFNKIPQDRRPQALRVLKTFGD